MTQTAAAAHIITADATGLGDPEIIIMTRDEGMGAEEIERRPLHDGLYGPVTQPGHLWNLVYANGWRPLGELTEVKTGYYIVDVEGVGR